MHPWLVEHIVFPLHERLKGKRTLDRLRELERTQWLAPDALRELQLERLRRLLAYARREVPYYARLLTERGVVPEQLGAVTDLAPLPFLDKAIIRDRFADLQPRTPLRGARRITTGGSTGAPMALMVDPARNAFADAVRLRGHRWFGTGIGAREIALWGSPIELGRQDRLRSLRDRLINYRLLSAFDLGDAALARYAEVLRRDRPAKLFGYASAVYLLARYLGRHGWTPAGDWPRAIFTTAEPLYDFQRSAIRSVFGCPVVVEYGCREAGVVATECPSGGIHIAAEGIVTEVVAADGTPATRGEIVLTVLDSWAMPIIRHRTGDIGTVDDGPCPCGRSLPALRGIEGRRTDFLVTPRGKVMHALAVNYIMREFPAIRQFQVLQERVDHLRVTIVPDPGFSAVTRQEVAARLGRLFDGADVAIEVADTVAPLASGKHRYVVSKVADQYLDGMLAPR
jgi:phenylacetate-CoA ligase